MIPTRKELARAERNKRIIKRFKELKRKDDSSNNRVITTIAEEEDLDRNWIYKILKKEEVI